MAKIIGTIESLKALKARLQYRGISRFNSVKEINEFLSNYDFEILKTLSDTSDIIEKEYSETCVNLKQRILDKAKIIDSESEKIEKEILNLKEKVSSIYSKNNSAFFKHLLSRIKLFFIKKRLHNLINNKANLINSSVSEISQKIKNDKLFIDEYKADKQKLIDKKAKPRIEELEYTQKVLKESKNLISGAIGENLVVKEIKKLSDDFVLINDFHLRFSPPIYYRKKSERISSIQIDHLLISKSGIFIIETKNWSKSSVNSTSLRSPIEQIERFNFALYIYISENIYLNDHHWGEKRIPLRNVIVMINNKPTGKFKYVNIKLLRELNNYISYFEPIFTKTEMNKIVEKLTYQNFNNLNKTYNLAYSNHKNYE